jgi:hypothetical protein
MLDDSGATYLLGDKRREETVKKLNKTECQGAVHCPDNLLHILPDEVNTVLKIEKS